MEAQQTQTVKLTKTNHAGRDEYYMMADAQCECCNNKATKLVGVNASMGQRKSKELCSDCLNTLQQAPNVIYDPVVLAKLD